MSKIEEIIKEKCPNGVDFYPLGEVCTVVRGASPRPIKNFITEEIDSVNWIKIGDVAVGSKYITSCAERITREGAKKSRFVKKGDFILSNSMSFGRPYILEIDGCIHDGWLAISDFEDKMITDYLYYVLVSGNIQREMEHRASFGGAVQNLNADIVRAIEIPVPPIEVQQEIVRILDKFTELEAELQAELEARKRQFSYVADKLLSLENTEAPQVSIKEICNDVFSGKNKERLEDGKYPVYGSTGIISSTNTAVYNKKQILIARVGANAGYVHIADGQYDVSDNTLIADVKDGISLMYIYYQMVYMNLHKYAKGGGQPLVTAGQIKNLTIPLPSLCEQEQIVSILQKFDTICNDEHSGIPAEIATRRRQYEFYRDSLLTFDRIGENV